jgi:hypothetical protein
MRSKYFIWIVRVPICLWEFSWNFGNFLSIFGALKHFLEFSGIVSAQNIFGKYSLSAPQPKSGYAPLTSLASPAAQPITSYYPKNPKVY